MAAAVLMIFLALFCGGVTLAGLTWLVTRRQRLGDGQGRGLDGPVVAEELGRLREELSLMQDEVSALNERLDFTERLLQSPPDGQNQD